DVAFAQLASALVDDPDLVTWQRQTAAHQRRRRLVVALQRNHDAPFVQIVGVNLFHPRPAVARREGRREHVFGKPVAGQQTRLAEADWPELLGERRESRRVDWLGPTAG